MITHLLALAFHGLCFGTATLVAVSLFPRQAPLPRALALALGAAIVTGWSYGVFWLWYHSPTVGIVGAAVSWAVVLGVALARRRQLRALLREPDIILPAGMLLSMGLLHLGTLHLFTTSFSVDELAAHRFVANLPVDNEIPRLFAERLRQGQSPRQLIGDWLSSDRPPLQTAVILFTAPLAEAVRLPWMTSAHAAAWWLQALWVPALWGLFRQLRLPVAVSVGLVAVLVLSGQTLLHGLYLWPKLGAAALVVIAATLALARGDAGPRKWVLAGGCAALAWLAHGGAAFSLLGLAAVLALFRRPALPDAAVAGLTFAVLAAPWIVYQKVYEPPGDRLLKWHLAGVIPPDPRSFGETLWTAYEALTPREVLAHKLANARRLMQVRPAEWLEPTPGRAEQRRISHFFDLLHATSPWIGAWLLLPWLAWRRHPAAGELALLVAWTGATVLAWVLLMFGPATTLIHQGSLAVPLITLAAGAVILHEVHRGLWVLLAAWQLFHFVTTWLPPSHRTGGAVSGTALAGIVAGLGGLGALAWLAHRSRYRKAAPDPFASHGAASAAGSPSPGAATAQGDGDAPDLRIPG